MRTSSLLKSLIVFTGLASFPLAHAAPVVVSIDNVSTLVHDYLLAGAGVFTSQGHLTGSTGGSFHSADFGPNSTNGTLGTTDASVDAATFQITVNTLGAHTGSAPQWVFETGGSGTGIGIHYKTGNFITFLHSKSGGSTNKIEFDATALVGTTFDIVASISPGSFMRLFVGGAFVQEQSIASSDNDWDGGNAGALGQQNSTAVENAGTFAIASGSLSNFKYFHDVLITDAATIPIPAPLALLAPALLVLVARCRRTT